MDFFLVYLLQRFVYRVGSFFHHWYGDGSRAIARRFMGTIAAADRSIALSVTVRHFFEPLYKDYSIVGRILGFVFRTIRIIIGCLAYVFAAAVYLILYLVWIAIPITLLYYAARTI